MSDEAKTDTPKKKGKGKLIILMLLGVILVGGGTAGGLWAAGMLGGAKAAGPEGPK